jgi:hypothetical protein
MELAVAADKAAPTNSRRDNRDRFDMFASLDSALDLFDGHYTRLGTSAYTHSEPKYFGCTLRSLFQFLQGRCQQGRASLYERL